MKKTFLLEEDARQFLLREDRNSLRLTAAAAAAACEAAAAHSLKITGIEGGIWRNPGFQSLLDSLWSAREGKLSEAELKSSNAAAAQFIRDETNRHIEELGAAPNVFILTARPN